MLFRPLIKPLINLVEKHEVEIGRSSSRSSNRSSKAMALFRFLFVALLVSLTSAAPAKAESAGVETRLTLLEHKITHLAKKDVGSKVRANGFRTRHITLQ